MREQTIRMITNPSFDEDQLIRVYDEEDRFLRIAEVDVQDMLAPKRLVVYS